MTAIAVRDGIMAADSGVWFGDLCFGSTQKIHRLSDGSLAAAAGPRPLIQEFHRWIAKVAASGDDYDLSHRPAAAEANEFGALWLKRDGSIWRISNKFDIYDDPGPFAADGMGINFMLGAMAHGASAEEAVRLAVRYHEGARGEVQVERIGLL